MMRKSPTTLAFVHNAADGERTFSFYRNPGADMMLRKEEVGEALLKETKTFSFWKPFYDIVPRQKKRQNMPFGQQNKMVR